MPNKQKKKQRQKERASEYFTRPLTLKKARKQVRTISRLATAPEKRQIKAEKRASRQQEKRINDYFPQYQQEVAKQATSSASAYDKAQQQIGQTSTESAQYAEELRQRLASEGAADAAKRGTVYNAESDKTDAAAQLARINASNVLSGVTAAQGASQAASFADKQATGERERIEQLFREKQRGRSFDQDLRSLARESRDIRRDEFSRLRDSERDYRMALSAAKLDRKGAKLDAKGPSQQRKLAKLYAKNDASSDERAADLARLQSRLSNRNDRRSAKRAKPWLNQGGSQGKGEKPGIGVAEATGMAQSKSAPKGSPQDTFNYLVNRGVEGRIAREVVKKLKKRAARNDYSRANEPRIPPG